MTYIDDISDTDMEHVKKQALLELTSLLDEQNILYGRRRAKRKYKGENEKLSATM